MGKAEGAIETYLVQQIRLAGGHCWKLGGNGILGLPDRVCPMPGGITLWVEVKAPGKKPDDIQWHYIHELEGIGHYATYVSTPLEVDALINFYHLMRRKQNG